MLFFGGHRPTPEKDSNTIGALDVDKEILSVEAEAAARLYGLDATRVRGVFHRLADVEWFWPKFPNCTAFDVAADALSPEEALELFESSDLADLRRRCAAIEYLAHRGMPGLTLNELEAGLTRFADTFARAEGELAETGYFGCRSKLAWLERRLGPVNLTKLPISIRNPPETPWELIASDDQDCSYLWTCETPFDSKWRFAGPGVRIFAYPRFNLETREQQHIDGRQVTHCSYGEAGPVFGLPEAMVARLEEERTRMIRAKAKILSFLRDAIRSDERDEVWPGVLALLTEEFLADEMEFYLQADVYYRELDLDFALSFLFQNGAAEETPLAGGVGGMSDLLTLVGHVEEELRIGAFCRPKSLFQDLFGTEELRASYFHYARDSAPRRIERVVDEFSRLEPAHSAFWKMHGQRVGRALAEEFDEIIAIRTRVRRKDVDTFQPSIQSFADWQALQLKSSGSLAAIGGAAPVDYVRTHLPASLSDDEEREFRAGQFRSRMPIEITGEAEARRSNRVMIDGEMVRLGDTTFALLLRLAVELYRPGDPAGWLPKGDRIREGGLVSEGYLSADGIDQGIARLRDRFEAISKERGLSRYDLIETRGKRVRLSTHRKLVQCDWERLRHHQDSRVSSLAEQISQSD